MLFIHLNAIHADKYPKEVKDCDGTIADFPHKTLCCGLLVGRGGGHESKGETPTRFPS